MTIIRTNVLRNVLISKLNDERGANTVIEIREGANTSIDGNEGTILATLTGNTDGWGVPTNGVLTSSVITADSSADESGTAAHYELWTVGGSGNGGTFLESGLVDTNGTDGVTIDNVTIVKAQTVQMSGSWVNTAAYGI